MPEFETLNYPDETQEQVPMATYCLIILAKEYYKLQAGEQTQEQFNKTLDWAFNLTKEDALKHLENLKRLENLKKK